MALAGAVGADDEHGGALGEVSAGGEIVNEGAVDVERAIEVELFQGLGGAKRCASQAQGKLLLLASGDLVLDVEGQGTRCRRVWTRPPGDCALPENRECHERDQRSNLVDGSRHSDDE